MMNRDTKSRATLNPGFIIGHESVTQQLPYSSTTEIPEGYGVVRNSSSQAELADDNSTAVYLTKVTSKTSTIQTLQESGPDPGEVAAVTYSAGGIPVWATRGHEFDMATANFDTTTEDPAADDYVCISDSTDGMLECVTTVSGRISFGRVIKVSNGRVYFTWTVYGTTHA